MIPSHEQCGHSIHLSMQKQNTATYSYVCTYIHTYMITYEYYSALKRKLQFFRKMDRLRIGNIEVTKSQKKINHMFSLICRSVCVCILYVCIQMYCVHSITRRKENKKGQILGDEEGMNLGQRTFES